MKKYTYLVEEKSCERDFIRNSSLEEDYLTNMGFNGWELVGVVAQAPTLIYDSTVYYFKKEIIGGE